MASTSKFKIKDSNLYIYPRAQINSITRTGPTMATMSVTVGFQTGNSTEINASNTDHAIYCKISSDGLTFECTSGQLDNHRKSDSYFEYPGYVYPGYMSGSYYDKGETLDGKPTYLTNDFGYRIKNAYSSSSSGNHTFTFNVYGISVGSSTPKIVFNFCTVYGRTNSTYTIINTKQNQNEGIIELNTDTIEAEKLTVVYHKNYDTDETAKQEFTYGVTGQTFSNPLSWSRTGYTLAGWKLLNSETTYAVNNGVADSWIADKLSNGYSVDLYAYWTPNILNITYNANGGAQDSSCTYKLPYSNTGSYLGYNNQNTNNGYANLWDAIGTFKLSKIGYHLEKDKEWYIKNSSGTITELSNTNSYSTVTLAAYGGGDLNNGEVSITVYANWKPNVLTINYYSNGATYYDGKEALPSGTTVNGGNVCVCEMHYKYDEKHPYGFHDYSWKGSEDKATLYMKKIGYTATGYWTTEISGGKEVFQTQNTHPEPDDNLTSQILAYQLGVLKSLEDNSKTTINLYAQWTPNILTVVYNSNSGNQAADDVEDIYKMPEGKLSTKKLYNDGDGTLLDVEGQLKLSRTGFHLTEGAEWKIFNDDTTTFSESESYSPAEIAAIAGKNLETGNAEVNLYVNWQINNYTIKYEANGGTGGSTANTELTYDYRYKIANNGFTRPGYKFIGWNTEADNTGTTYAAGDEVINLTDADGATIILYAIWEALATMFIKVDNKFRAGIPYVKKNSLWKKGIAVFIKVSGTWKLSKRE